VNGVVYATRCAFQEALIYAFPGNGSARPIKENYSRAAVDANIGDKNLKYFGSLKGES
jgi:N-formylglutamate amidohydrolase